MSDVEFLKTSPIIYNIPITCCPIFQDFKTREQNSHSHQSTFPKARAKQNSLQDKNEQKYISDFSF